MVAEERASDKSDARMGFTIGRLPQRRRAVSRLRRAYWPNTASALSIGMPSAGDQATERDRIELVARNRTLPSTMTQLQPP